jgi:protein-tyrosine phosphatase
MLISDEVHVWREPDGDYHIEWRSSHPDTEVTVEALAEGGTLLAQEGERARLGDLAPAQRHFFRLCDQHGNETVVTERRLGMQGTPNFRDFGGYPSSDGGKVRWGYMFRSGQLNNLTGQDLELMAGLELDIVCDFRQTEEQQREPSRFPAQRSPRVVSLPIIPGSNARFLEEAEQHMGEYDAMYSFMIDINRDFAEGQTETYARMFREILAVEDARFLVHCAAGKDRTGFAAALVLLALGVSREIVMADYLLTARYFTPEAEMARLQRKYNMDHLDGSAILPMLEVHDVYLGRGLDVIADNYGSIEAYLSQALGVGAAELAELRRRYLE